MSRFSAYYDRKRSLTARQMARVAELVSEGWTITAAGRELGVKQQRALVIWRAIKDELGSQAI